MKIKNNGKEIILIIMFLTVIVLGVLNFTLDPNRKLTMPEKIIKDIVVGTQNILYAPINFIDNKIEYYKEMKEIYNKYEDLDVYLLEKEALENEINELNLEIDSLKELLEIKTVLTDYDYINASVISRNIGYWYDNFMIDKGIINNLEENLAVVHNGVLIGKTNKTSYFNSEVTLLTSNVENNNIPVKIDSKEEVYGVITYYDKDKNLLTIEGVSNTLNVSINDVVSTSGLGGIFPGGILIGKVKEITTDSYDLAKIIKVEPSLNLNNLKYVQILKRSDQ